MSFRMISTLLLTAMIAACAASSQKLNYVRIGMLKSEVIQIMGEPAYTTARPGTEVLNYQLSSGGLSEDQYIVRLTDGKVDLIGQRYDWNSAY